MTQSSASNPFDAFFEMARAWLPVGMAAPDKLNQSILQGWSLITVNESNSKAPDTERAVVAKASYGRQLGRIMGAVEELIKVAPDAVRHTKAITDFDELVDMVETAKLQAAEARAAAMIADLEQLEQKNAAEYMHLREALLVFLDRHRGQAASHGSAP